MIFVMSAFCDLFIGINLSQSMELSSSQIATGQLTYSLEKALCTAPFRIFWHFDAAPIRGQYLLKTHKY